jgi:hypothetical protein
VKILPPLNFVKCFKKEYNKQSLQIATIPKNQTFIEFAVDKEKNLSTGIA